ncbi:hypothetical protein V8C42DRAFT_336141 [Trichoderma barbatum]
MNSDSDSDNDFSIDGHNADIHSDGEGDHEARFNAACREIKDAKRVFIETEVDHFFSHYPGDICQFASSKGNLLHALVNVVTHNEIKPQNIECLVRRLVENFPGLLNSPNEEGYNPVFMAIKASHYELVDYMVTACAAMKREALHEQSLNNALSDKMKDGKTCLHLAIEKDLNAETIKALVENASDKGLTMQDDDGKTPMHHATQFKRCTDAGVELINLFLERDLHTIQNKNTSGKTFLDVFDANDASVYSQLQATTTSGIKKYNDWLQKRLPSAENNKIEYQAAPRISTDRYGRDYEDNQLDSREKERQLKKLEETGNLKKLATMTRSAAIRESGDRNRDTSRDRSSRPNAQDGWIEHSTAGGISAPEVAPNTAIKRRGTARGESVQGKEKNKSATKSSQKKPAAAEYMPVLTKNSTNVLLNLKIHYMRTRSTEMATSFLYGINTQDVQISFDYDSLPRRLLWNEFLKRFGTKPDHGRLSFDNVLQYVTLPRVSVDIKGRLADMEREAEEESGVRYIGALGRKDTKYFLDWLFDKGVRHIISLSVEDSGRSGEKVHSDQVIQESLERLIVEHLDWQKMDLDPETILRVGCKTVLQDGSYSISENSRINVLPASHHIRQLSLRWSGSNAVLRAWSEPEGLVLLPKLQKIKLFKPSPSKDYDSPQWIHKIVYQFQRRLNTNRKAIRDQAVATSNDHSIWSDMEFGDVEVITVNSDNEEENVSTTNAALPFTTPSSIKDVNPHRWLDSTARFANEMGPFWQRTIKDFLASRSNLGTTERVEDDVIIALVDDGVDMFDTSLSDRVLEGKSFDYHDGKVRPSFASAEGHGTVMANMILRMCPMAKVYPIRLKTHPNANGKRNIDAYYAAQAIQAALNKKATIISMSWTLPMAKNQNKSKSPLYDVLQKAVDKNVLMFCSAPDDGKFTELDYPSGPWRDRFFRIGAAAADGTVFQWTPDVDITYVLPGVEVIVDHSFQATERFNKRAKDFKFETGSSVATALAAGLAAMVIYCVKASILSIKTANQNKGSTVGITIADDAAKMIANPDSMKRAFARLGEVTKVNFIQVWEKLDHISDTLEVLNGKELKPEERLKYLKDFIEFGCDLASAIKA